MIVAIVSAIRTSWKDEGNIKDEWYFWRNAHSNIWYSSEIVGTIIVQCIPVLRPLLRDMHTSLTSKKLPSIHDVPTNPSKRASKYKAPETFGSSGHRAHIYSTHNDHEDGPDSWDNQGIYQKLDFELTTVEVERKDNISLV
jgi:hypothetical protein